MKNKIIQRNRSVFFVLVLFFLIVLQSQAEFYEINSSTSTMRHLKLKITRVQHTGGPYGSYGFNIVAYCKWRRVFNNYWGKWTSDNNYADNQGASLSLTGVISSINSNNTYSVYSDYCSVEDFQIEFKVWKRGIWLFDILTDEGQVTMGTRTYSSESLDQIISFNQGDFEVTVTFSVYD